MLTYREYKVLSLIKQIYDEESLNSNYSSSFKFQEKIIEKVSELNIEVYELNEIMRSLDKKGYICNIFNNDTKDIYCTEIMDSGKVALKNYKKDLVIFIFNKYIWIVLTIIITAILTGYFTAYFTK